MIRTPADYPSVAEQIAWLRERAADAEQLREMLVAFGNVRADKAERDAALWKAVLHTLQMTPQHAPV